jgi:type IV secretion system protein VirD4
VDSLNDNSRKRLVEAAELAGPAYKDRQIVVAMGTKPAIVRKEFAFANPELKRRMDLAQPGGSS